MSQPLEYAPPSRRQPSKVLAFFANAALAFPLFFAGCLYGQWLLSWAILGHVPQPSLDDPKDIAVAHWLHPLAALALLGLAPMAPIALLVNCVYVFYSRLRGRRLAARALLLLLLWIGVFVLLRLDPGRVLYWWFD